MESDSKNDEEGKIFVGGLSWETTQEKLEEYFVRFGEVTDSVVMKNNDTGKSRGFGFITYKDPKCVAKVLSSGPHELDGRTIDPKVCSARDSQQNKKSGQYPKVFLGGLPLNCTETDLRSYFSRYGTVVEVVLMYDQERKKPRGFGFLSFETEDSVKQVCAEHFVKINGKKIEVKHAEPRDKKSSSQPSAPPQNQQWTAQGPQMGPPTNWGPSGNQSGPPGPNMGPSGPMQGPMGPPMNNGMMGPPGGGFQGGWGGPGPYGPQGWGPQPGPYGPPNSGWGWGPGPYGAPYGCPPGPQYGQPGYGYGYNYGGGYGPGPMGNNAPPQNQQNPPQQQGNEGQQQPPPNNNNAANTNNNNNSGNNNNPGPQAGPVPSGLGNNYQQDQSNFGPTRQNFGGQGFSNGPNYNAGGSNFPNNNFANQANPSQSSGGPQAQGYHPYRRQ